MLSLALPSEIEQWVKEEIASGRYRSAEEVIGEALKVWKIRGLREEIARGLEDLKSGRFTDYDDSTIERLFDEIRAND